MGDFYGNQHVDGPNQDYDYEDLKASAVAFADEHGEPPTTEEAANDDRFPSIAKLYWILDGSWNDLLEDAGLERGHVGEYGPEDEARMLQDMRRVLETVESEYLTTRQYAEHGEYADDTVKRTFGSWREACERANVDAGERYGIACEGPQGSTLDSLQQLQVAQALHERGVEYEVHPELGETDWVSDFHLPTFDLWVEVDGFADGERPDGVAFERKLEYYEAQGLECVVVEAPEELVDELRGRGGGA